MASRSPDAAVAGATVLVTGAHGFIGRAVVAEVHSLGARPVCPYRPDAPPSVIGSSYALARAWSSATDHGAPHLRGVLGPTLHAGEPSSIHRFRVNPRG